VNQGLYLKEIARTLEEGTFKQAKVFASHSTVSGTALVSRRQGGISPDYQKH
jgi:hypothetical protein